MHKETLVVLPVLPSAWARRLISGLVVAHFAAIFLAVTSYSAPNFPAPQLAVWASRPLQPYLQATFFNNAYRFFAPNPGTPAVLWFRIQYLDRSVRWLELPGRSAALVRAPYQRRLNLAVQLGQYLAPMPAGAEPKALSALGKTLLPSCIRHVASAAGRQAADGSPLAVRTVGVYCVLHGVLLPAQVRAGWMPTDLRTYRATFLGAYTPDGERVDRFRPSVVDQPIAYVTAGILEVDVLPHLQEHGTPGESLAELCLPEPIQELLARHPELLAVAPGAELKAALAALVPERAEGQR